MTKRLTILGSTGSIGTQTLSVVEGLGIEIESLTCGANWKLLSEQAMRFNPKYVCAADAAAADELKIALAHTNIKVLKSSEGIREIASEDRSDTVLTSVVGVAGLVPTVEAIKAGKNIALANKETLVAAGKLVTDLVKEHNVKLLPVDSEHSAIFQCLQASGRKSELKKVILTASGGPFFGKNRQQLSDIKAEQALKHPNWSMGRKITVDSATLMNKGLEFIEAMWLFDVSPDMIEITVHRQSIVHSMVEFCDGAVLAQLGVPDMKLPIQYALTYPVRLPMSLPELTIEKMSNLTFERPDETTFECLAACKTAARNGGTSACIANAANEQAVSMFLGGKTGFLDIGHAVTNAVNTVPFAAQYTLDDLLETDREVRSRTVEFLNGRH